LPDTGYHVANVEVDDTPLGPMLSYTFTSVTTDHTISVMFAIDAPVTHTITATAGENGAITPSGAVTVDDGTSQTFTFTPVTGYHISSVVVDGTPLTAPLPPSYTFTNVITDHTIHVTFASGTISVTFAVEPSGTGSTSPSGTQSYTGGQVVPISATDTNANDGYVFSYWSATGAITIADPYAASTTATINGDGTIIAHFRIPTSMAWYTTPPDLTLGESEDITGVLYNSQWPWWLWSGLNGRQVTLVYTAPNSTQFSVSLTTAVGPSWLPIWPGIFEYSFTPDAIGSWSVYAQFDGDSTYGASRTDTIYFTVSAP
jgi:hypothetical protein